MKFLNIIGFLLITQLSFGQQGSVETASEYQVLELSSAYFPDQLRMVKISLPENYDSSKVHPVVYTLDGYSLFELTSSYVYQLSRLTIEDDLDYATDAIPQAIVVGIFHNDRNYETTPNFSKYASGDETVYLEGSEKLKNFLFREVVPYINSTYNTSGYNSIIGHSNTAHFVMCLPFQEENPFQGIISLSLSGESENFKRKVSSYLLSNDQTNVFIGYGTKDHGYNEFAQYLKGEVIKDHLKISGFIANHNEMPALSLTQGLKFLFREYRNIEDFRLEAGRKDFNIESYLKAYRDRNKKAYGIDVGMKEDDLYSLLQMSVDSKNSNALNQILEYTSKVSGYPTQTHMLFFYNKEVGDLDTAENYANQMLNSDDDFENRVLKANLDLYYDFFMDDIKDVEKAVSFFEKGKKRFQDNQLEFSFFLAKAAIDGGLKNGLGRANLEFCMENFKENRYFREEDLERLK